MTIYLYVKTHKVTGLKYLGKTSQNPFSYKGSGKYWKLHLNKHGNICNTEILRECNSLEEIKFWGEFYSKLWNIVDDDSWANLKPESGDGGDPGPIGRLKLSISLRGRLPWNKGKISTMKGKFLSEETKLKMSKPKSIQHKEKHRGRLNSKYDHTIYSFEHVTGLLEACTRHDLRLKYNLRQSALSSVISGNRISTNGWKVIR